ncbi:hypothetical protein BJ508DRAFT_366596 [Ascobolus immersus RN42]|uniref:Uncharacterized protein n=1 Tax=Ascobolus immersus RN42 TaxID=1160509 RepID=A0A3N4HIJ4_ASCIM|nr:hypothetical protein BJ508DRAFT_366596 [Ascobolus immersus RN42]
MPAKIEPATPIKPEPPSTEPILKPEPTSPSATSKLEPPTSTPLTLPERASFETFFPRHNETLRRLAKATAEKQQRRKPTAEELQRRRRSIAVSPSSGEDAEAEKIGSMKRPAPVEAESVPKKKARKHNTILKDPLVPATSRPDPKPPRTYIPEPKRPPGRKPKCSDCHTPFDNNASLRTHIEEPRSIGVTIQCTGDDGDAKPEASQALSVRIHRYIYQFHCPLRGCEFVAICRTGLVAHLHSEEHEGLPGRGDLKEGCVLGEGGVWEFHPGEGLEVMRLGGAEVDGGVRPTVAEDEGNKGATGTVIDDELARSSTGEAEAAGNEVRFKAMKAQLEERTTKAIMAEHARVLEAPGPTLLEDLVTSQERIAAIMAYHKETLKQLEGALGDETIGN